MILFLSGCGGGHDRLDVSLSGAGPGRVVIHRYDADLFRIDRNRLDAELERLKPEYPFFLDTDLGDTAKTAAMRSYLENPRNLSFHRAVDSVYRSTETLEKELALAFRHYLHYFPGSGLPRVYTYISGGDYNAPVQWADSVLLIGLDNYLGDRFRAYAADGLPSYRVARMTAAHVVPGCMEEMYRATFPRRMPGTTLLDYMVEAGKKYLFIDAMIPGTDDRLKIGYNPQQHDWILKNESHVWAAIVSNRMLYSTDGNLIRTFMADGPFTAEFSREAPPRLGEWIGWQIVRKYYQNRKEVSLKDLMAADNAQEILTLSGYKPEK